MLMQTGHAMVMDFGLAKQLAPPSGAESAEETVTALYLSLRQLKKYDDVAAMEKQFFADFPEIWSVVEKAYPESGHSGAWRKAADVHAKYYGKGQAAMDIADSYLLGGDKQGAIRWLEKAYDEHDPNLPYIACFPQWDALRSEPGFKDLLRRMNLQKQSPDRLSLRSFIRDLNQS